MASKKEIVIIGASGLIGRATALRLYNEPGFMEEHRLNLISRSGKSPFDLSNNKLDPSEIKNIKLNLFNKDSLRRLFQEISVYKLIIAVQFPGHPVERPWLGSGFSYLGFEPVIVRNILSSLNQTIQNLIYISGAGAGSGLDYSWIQAKEQAEKLIINSGLSYIILRPSWVYGKRDRSMTKLIELAKNKLPFFPVIGDGSNFVNPVWVEDLAKIIQKAGALPEKQNQTLEIAGAPITMQELAKSIVRRYAPNKRIINLPAKYMKLLGFVAQYLPNSLLSPGSVDFINMPLAFKPYQSTILDVKLTEFQDGLFYI